MNSVTNSITNSLTNSISVFTDGSSLGNNQKTAKRYGGASVFFGDGDARNISQELTVNVTNQNSELMGILCALHELDQCGKIIYIYTDSKYSIDVITSWSKTWEKNGWKKKDGKAIQNLAVVKKICELYKQNTVIFKHVRGHKEEPDKTDPEKYAIWYGNMMADKLATTAAATAKNRDKKS
ncbi:MAG: putative ribonuclease H1 [Faunusvirus sp.]|jgi:ribonuclease HI|uniref:ribonuclease H n=1 Tax=Faunusvirus sp. TaxID=2487766 RepID=A0A3G4ZWD2_9VIRU|nr:MAG: putative ribonuclease H1 [Faunusvirus sp.]